MRVSEPGVFSPSIQSFAPVGGRSPAVSVVMAAGNDLRFLDEAVQGVLNQSFTDFELIVVDNGSAEPMRVGRLAALDSRVRVLRLEENLGPTGGGNFGIAAARAPIIARMDADDFARPGWLAALMDAFAADDQLGLVGTWADLMSEHGDPIGTFRTPASDFAIRFTMLSHNPFIHSSTAYRKALFDLVDGSAAHSIPLFELGLWRAMLPHCRARNLPQPLVRYRYNSKGVSASWARGESRLRSRAMRLALWGELGLDYPFDDLALAECFDDFLSEHPCKHVERWPDLRHIIELAANGMQGREERFMRPDDAPVRDAFVADLIARHERGPKRPPGPFARAVNAARVRGLRRTLAAAIRGFARSG